MLNEVKLIHVIFHANINTVKTRNSKEKTESDSQRL